MKKILCVIALILVAYAGYLEYMPRVAEPPTGAASSINSDSDVARAFENQTSNVQVQGQGVVSKVLPDDNDGSRHQRFILRLNSTLTVLIAHNIDLAPRVSSLGVGDTISFYGEYEWNSKGGVIHWTHDDPAGRHPAGWLMRNGQKFQ